MVGRKPIGPPLVHRLDGSERAKDRMETILETVAGTLTIRQACDRLGIDEARFFQLRTEALQAGLSRLEPRPLGRPPQQLSPEQQRIVELEEQLREKERQQRAMEAKLEIALVMPQLVKAAGKKTIPSKSRGRQLARRHRQPGKRPKSSR
jgi:hypothetical protein